MLHCCHWVHESEVNATTETSKLLSCCRSETSAAGLSLEHRWGFPEILKKTQRKLIKACCVCCRVFLLPRMNRDRTEIGPHLQDVGHPRHHFFRPCLDSLQCHELKSDCKDRQKNPRAWKRNECFPFFSTSSVCTSSMSRTACFQFFNFLDWMEKVSSRLQFPQTQHVRPKCALYNVPFDVLFCTVSH